MVQESFVFLSNKIAHSASKIMVQEICVFQKMTHVLTDIKMMEDLTKNVLYLVLIVMKDLKIMDLEIYVFLTMNNVLSDIKMMEQE